MAYRLSYTWGLHWSYRHAFTTEIVPRSADGAGIHATSPDSRAECAFLAVNLAGPAFAREIDAVVISP